MCLFYSGIEVGNANKLFFVGDTADEGCEPEGDRLNMQYSMLGHGDRMWKSCVIDATE